MARCSHGVDVRDVCVGCDSYRKALVDAYAALLAYEEKVRVKEDEALAASVIMDCAKLVLQMKVDFDRR